MLGSVLPMKIQIFVAGFDAPVVYHLCALITYSSPSRVISPWIFVASDEATAGSVIGWRDADSAAL